MKKIIISLFFVIVLFASQSWAIDMSKYAPPLNSGDSKTYLQNGSQYIIDTVLGGTYPLNGSVTKIIASSKDNTQTYVSNDSYGRREHKAIGSIYIDGRLVTVTVVLNPPAVYAYPTANIGDQVNTSGSASMIISGLGTYQASKYPPAKPVALNM